MAEEQTKSAADVQKPETPSKIDDAKAKASEAVGKAQAYVTENKTEIKDGAQSILAGLGAAAITVAAGASGLIPVALAAGVAGWLFREKHPPTKKGE
jgi:hypothetical protein